MDKREEILGKIGKASATKQEVMEAMEEYAAYKLAEKEKEIDRTGRIVVSKLACEHQEKQLAELKAWKEARIKELEDGLRAMVKTYDTFTGACPAGSSLSNAKQLLTPTDKTVNQS